MLAMMMIKEEKKKKKSREKAREGGRVRERVDEVRNVLLYFFSLGYFYLFSIIIIW